VEESEKIMHVHLYVNPLSLLILFISDRY